MTINLATYQVTVGGEPLDFTYLEYALLAFLVTHPGRTYSARCPIAPRVGLRLLRRFSRTVDVHVQARSRKARTGALRSIWKRCAASAIFGAHSRQTVLV